MDFSNVNWGRESIVSYYENHRLSTSDVYPSEWFFLKDLLDEGISVLDLGCALGGFANILSEHLSNFTYTGLDISAEMIQRAKQKHPQHRFYHIVEAEFSVLRGDKFDLALCLGILHLTRKWRELISSVWNYTRRHLLLDLRETHLRSIEDSNLSYLWLRPDKSGHESSGEHLPYNVINTTEALQTIASLRPEPTNISRFGYLHAVSSAAVCPLDRVMMHTYSIEK